MSAEVPVWDMGKLKSFHPEMTMQVQAPPADVLDVVAAALEGAKFKIKDRDAGGFKARYIDLLALASGTINRTTLEVTAPAAPADPETTVVTVEGGYDGTDRSGRKHASKGLSSAVVELRRRGIEVTTTAWAAPGTRG